MPMPACPPEMGPDGDIALRPEMLPGIERPAICAPLPTANGHTHMLDLGANVDCGPEHLLQFGIMGSSLISAMERKSADRRHPQYRRRGNQGATRSSKQLPSCCVPLTLNFIGNVEGDGIYKGDADVIVCDGLSGNVALKTSEAAWPNAGILAGPNSSATG